MNAYQRLAVTLSPEMADAMRRKVEAGEYDSPQDMLQEALKRLLDADASLETWLREEVVPGHTEYLDDPSRAMPAEKVMDHLRKRRGAGTDAA